MILADHRGMSRQNRNANRINLGLALPLGGPFGQTGLRGFLGFASSIRALLLRPIMRAGFFLVLAATTAEEKLNLLSVGTAHLASVLRWQRAEKRSTMPQGKIPS